MQAYNLVIVFMNSQLQSMNALPTKMLSLSSADNESTKQTFVCCLIWLELRLNKNPSVGTHFQVLQSTKQQFYRNKSESVNLLSIFRKLCTIKKVTLITKIYEKVHF